MVIVPLLQGSSYNHGTIIHVSMSSQDEETNGIHVGEVGRHTCESVRLHRGKLDDIID